MAIVKLRKPPEVDPLAAKAQEEFQSAFAETQSGEEPVDVGPSAAQKPIGELLAEFANLSAEEMRRILRHQRKTGARFGDAAVELGIVSREAVMHALSVQFHYPVAAEGYGRVHTDLVMLAKPFSAQAESIRAIRSQVLLRCHAKGQPRKALAVVSPSSGDGKTFFAANLAISLAQLGSRTLLVDGDLRGPRLHELFDVENKTGLSGVLSGRSGRGVIKQAANITNLFLLPVGTTPPNPLELVERQAFALLVREMLAKFDHVVVDTPAASHGSDAAAIAARCGAALVVARQHSARVAQLQDLVANLAETSAQLVGVVVNEF